MDQVDEAHTPFRQTPGEKAVPGECAPGVGAALTSSSLFKLCFVKSEIGSFLSSLL